MLAWQPKVTHHCDIPPFGLAIEEEGILVIYRYPENELCLHQKCQHHQCLCLKYLGSKYQDNVS